MVGELITLPLRVGIRATRLWFRVAEETASLAATATGRLIELAASRGSDESSTEVWAVSVSEPTGPREVDFHDQPREVDSHDQGSRGTGRSVETARPPAVESSSRTAPSATPEPTHVSEEPALVEEFAEPGAEDGAGAEIHISEPWEGYAQVNAKQVTARLTGAAPAALASVQLYESRHRRRQTILNAVQRELRSASGSSSPNQ